SISCPRRASSSLKIALAAGLNGGKVSDVTNRIRRRRGLCADEVCAPIPRTSGGLSMRASGGGCLGLLVDRLAHQADPPGFAVSPTDRPDAVRMHAVEKLL